MEDVKKEIQTMYEDELLRQLQLMEDLEGDELTKAVESFERMYKLEQENEKQRAEQVKIERESIKNRKDNVHRWIEHGLDILKIAAPLAVGTVWTIMGFNYEETGVVSSPTFKDILNKRFKMPK